MMTESGKRADRTIPLPITTSLEHRGGLAPNVASLFPSQRTLEALGGPEAIAKLVDGLYDRIDTDPVLRPAFGRDLIRERERVKLFFEGWFGGSPAYFDAAWPPGLKAVHGSTTISRGMAVRWVGHFLDSFAEAAKDPHLINEIRPLISRIAMALVDRGDEPVAGERLHCSAYGTDPRLLPFVQRDDAEGIANAAAGHPEVIQREGPRLLLVAAVRGKARATEALLRLGVDANAVAMLAGSEASAAGLPMLRMTPLCGALAKRRADVVKLLMQRGAQYDVFTAAFMGDVDGVSRMLDLAPELADACDPACDVAQITPLMHAVHTAQIEVARLLLRRGATVGPNSVRLIRVAANGGHEVLVDLLLEHGADPASIGAGTWVLYPAIAGKLIARGADVNREPGAWVGLCCTGNSGHKENADLARAMLRCGADVSSRYGGATALHCAAKAGFDHVVQALIEHGADVHALNDKGQTPLESLQSARKSIDTEPVRRLLLMAA